MHTVAGSDCCWDAARNSVGSDCHSDVARNPVGSDQRWDAARNPVGSPCFPEDYPLPRSAVSPVERLSPDSAVADAAAACPGLRS